MLKFLRTFLPLLILLTCFGCDSSLSRPRPNGWAQPIRGTTIRNMYRVSPELYRSAQFDVKDIRDLEKLGIRSILNLRDYHSDEALVTTQPIRLYSVPMSAGSISKEEISKAMHILRTAPKPILVHCMHGSDRTGAVVAMYRMVFQDWSRENAIEEMRNGGYGFHSFWYPNIVTLLQEIDLNAYKNAS